MDTFSCTESTAGPILDVIWLGLWGVTLATADPSSYDAARLVVAGGAVAGVLGSAAAVGFNKSKRCRAAKRQLADRLVERGAPRGVVIDPATDTVVVDERVQLTATARNSSGRTIPTAVLTWSSSDSLIASVTNAGSVTGRAIGSVIITATTDRVLGTAHIVVVGKD